MFAAEVSCILNIGMVCKHITYARLHFITQPFHGLVDIYRTNILTPTSIQVDYIPNIMGILYFRF